MQSDTEIVLLACLKQDDRHAFDQCYLTYRKPLLGAAFVILQDEEEAKDVVQQLFIDLWEKKLYLSVTGSLKSFLYIATKNRCLNQLEKKNTRQKHLTNVFYQATASISPEERLEQQEEREALSLVIQKMLHPQTYKVLELAYLQGKSRNEIAAETGTSPNTIRNQLVNGLKILRKNLKR